MHWVLLHVSQNLFCGIPFSAQVFQNRKEGHDHS